MSTIPDFVRALPQDADGLLRALSAKIDDEMLREIASADYGQDVERHLAPLKVFRDTGTFPKSWDIFRPMECLELIRWSQPDDPEWRPSGRGASGHWMRAFSAACVLRYRGEFRELGGENSLANSLAPLVASLIQNDGGLGSELAGFCSWLSMRFDDEVVRDDTPTFAVVVLLASLKLGLPLSDEAGANLAREAVKSASERSKWYWLYAEPWRALAKALSACSFSHLSRDIADDFAALIAALDHDIDPEMQAWLDERRAEREAWLAKSNDGGPPES